MNTFFKYLLGIALIQFSLASGGITIGEPSVIVTDKEFSLITGQEFQPDASLSTVRTKEGNYWYLPMWDKSRGGIVHARTLGDLEHPFGKIEWVKRKGELFKNVARENEGNYWIANTYKDENGILAFIHVENAQGTNEGGTGRSRAALGWSSDGGDTFNLLGNIIIPFADPPSFNVQGIPYIIIEGFFYIYYHDSTGLSMARAPVKEVIDAARRGRVSDWMKYDGPTLGFSSNGKGGHAQSIGIDGISHADAACSSYNGKCYLLLTRMNYRGGDTWIKLFESSDGIAWKFAKLIIKKPTTQATEGFQYATIINGDGRDNGEVGNTFDVLCYKDFQQNSRSIVRWRITLLK